MEQVGLIVLGAVLALMTSDVVEFVKIWLNDRRTKKQFRNFIKMDIPSIQASIDRLVQDTAKLGFMPVIILNELDAIRQGYDRLRHWVILFKEDKFQRDLIDYYQRLRSTSVQANLLESQQPIHNMPVLSRASGQCWWQNLEILRQGGEIYYRGSMFNRPG